MKKKFFAAAVAFAAAASLAASAFAAAPGATNGKVEAQATAVADQTTEIKTDIGLELEAPAGVFPEGVEVKLEADVKPVEAASNAAKTVEDAVAKLADVSGEQASVTLNTYISVSLTSDGAAIQPNGSVKVTVPFDGKSNAVAYVNGVSVEFFKLVVDGTVCSFETGHFSDYYMVNVDEAVIEKIAGQSVTVDGGAVNNPGTGIALAVAPAALAVAFVGVTAIISKKKRG